MNLISMSATIVIFDRVTWDFIKRCHVQYKGVIELGNNTRTVIDVGAGIMSLDSIKSLGDVRCFIMVDEETVFSLKGGSIGMKLLPVIAHEMFTTYNISDRWRLQ